LEEELKERFRV
jgi:hypothetical protein